MPKVLTAARVRVPTQNETEYVNTLRELTSSPRHAGSGSGCTATQRSAFVIEFSESPTEMSHRPRPRGCRRRSSSRSGSRRWHVRA